MSVRFKILKTVYKLSGMKRMFGLPQEKLFAKAAQLNAKRVTIYKLVDGKPQIAMARLGASDGSSTEISGRDIAEGDLVIAGEQSATESK